MDKLEISEPVSLLLKSIEEGKWKCCKSISLHLCSGYETYKFMVGDTLNPVLVHKYTDFYSNIRKAPEYDLSANQFLWMNSMERKAVEGAFIKEVKKFEESELKRIEQKKQDEREKFGQQLKEALDGKK